MLATSHEKRNRCNHCNEIRPSRETGPVETRGRWTHGAGHDRGKIAMNEKLKAGDRVVTSSVVRRHGTIVRVSKVSALVHFDGDDRDDNRRVYINALRRETAADVARRDHEDAMRAWRARQPETRRARVTSPTSWSNSDPNGAVVYGVATPDEMREAARELALLADWFAGRPEVR